MKHTFVVILFVLSLSVNANEKLNFEEPVTLKKTEFNLKKIYMNFLQIYQAIADKKPKPDRIKNL